MSEWSTSEVITAAKLNQKELYVGAAAPGTTYAGMLWFDTDDNVLKQRNAANTDWVERPGLSLAATITGLWTFNRGAAPPFAVGSSSLKVAFLDADLVDGKHIPNTTANILSDHNKAAHDALNIDADTVDGEEAAAIVTNSRVKAHFPDTTANILSDHNKAAHDALAIYARYA